MKMILCAPLLFAFTSCFAQSSFYLHPAIGLGLGNAKISDNTEPSSKGILGYNFQLGATYRYKKLFVNTGIGYMRTGREVVFTYWISNGASTGTITYFQEQKQEKYYHVFVPLSLGYKFRAGKKLAFIPAIGGGISYNAFVRYQVNGPVFFTGFNTTRTFEGNHMKEFNKFSFWGSAQADLVYSLSPGISIVAGPAVHYMLTNLVNQDYYRNDPAFRKKINNYALLFNIGLRCRMSK